MCFFSIHFSFEKKLQLVLLVLLLSTSYYIKLPI